MKISYAAIVLAVLGFTLTFVSPGGTVRTDQGTDTVTAGKIVAANVVQGGLATVSGTAASAASRPAIQVNTNGWAGMKVEPHHIYIGQGGSPFIRRMHWTHWSQRTAAGHGRLIQMIPGCTQPTYLCPVSHHRVWVYLHRVRSHDGVLYFSRMRWTKPNGHRSYWRFNRALGGTVPAWN
jgi:hypothetical protein